MVGTFIIENDKLLTPDGTFGKETEGMREDKLKEIKIEKSKNTTTNFLWKSTFIISRIGADHDRPSDFTKILGFHFLASCC